MNKWFKTLNSINTYRVHVVFLFLLIVCLYSLNIDINIFQKENTILILISFVSLLAGLYVGNKYFDYLEDTISQEKEARKSSKVLFFTVVLHTLPFALIW